MGRNSVPGNSSIHFEGVEVEGGGGVHGSLNNAKKAEHPAGSFSWVPERKDALPALRLTTGILNEKINSVYI